MVCFSCTTTDHLYINQLVPLGTVQVSAERYCSHVETGLGNTSGSPKLQTGKACSSFFVVTEYRVSKFNATTCEKGYQRFMPYHTSLSTNSKEFTDVLKLKTHSSACSTSAIPWLKSNLNIFKVWRQVQVEQVQCRSLALWISGIPTSALKPSGLACWNC